MTQLQEIIREFTLIKPNSYQGAAWKKASAEGNVIGAIAEIKVHLVEGPESIISSIGDRLSVLIKDFNPVKEAEVLLYELIELCKQPKDSRNFVAIRKLIGQCEALYKMAEGTIK